MAILHIRRLALAAVASTVLLSLPSGCKSTSASRSPSAPVGQEINHGPPSHAPAHGYRRKYSYVHYPSCNVYFDRERKLWFWIEGDSWRMGVELPSRIRIDTGEGVTVELDTDTPSASRPASKGSGKHKKH